MIEAIDVAAWIVTTILAGVGLLMVILFAAALLAYWR